MSCSPLHQRLYLRLAVRQSFSSPALLPLPPDPASSLHKELPVSLTTALPSSELTRPEHTVIAS